MLTIVQIINNNTNTATASTANSSRGLMIGGMTFRFVF